jgi:hypothetical protein
MNVLSSLNFGKVLKIALPGFVATLGLGLAIDAGLALVSAKPHVFLSWMEREPVLASFLAIPAVILAGLTINAILFTYLLDRLVRHPYDAEHREFLAAQDDVFRELISSTLESRAILEPPTRANFARHVDAGAFLLPTVDLQRFLYYQESYWSYLEFSLNMIIALAAAAGALCFWATVNVNGLSVTWWRVLIGLAVATVFLAALAMLFLVAARQNYKKHRAKFLSLFVGEAYAKETKASGEAASVDAAAVSALVDKPDLQTLGPTSLRVEND